MKRLLSLILSLVLVAACFSAVADYDHSAVPAYPNVMDHTAFSQFPLVAEGEKETITVGTVRNAAYGSNPEDNWFWRWSSEVTGIDFDVTQLTDATLSDQKSLMFAADDLPELILQMELSTSELLQYGMEEGQLKDLLPYINADTMPYLTKWFEAFPEAKATCTTPDGKMYTLPFFTNLGVPVGMQEVININLTLLEECGMEIPTTVEELTAFLYKVKELHPDYIPMCGIAGVASVPNASSGGNTYNPMSYLLNAYGYLTEGTNDYGYEVALKNGEVVIPCGDPDFVEFLKLANQYYTDGIMQSDFFTADSITVTALMTEHRTALFPNPSYTVLPNVEDFQQWSSVKPLISAQNPTPQWKKNDPITCGGVALASYTSDKHVDLILRYLDFFYSELGEVYLWEGPLYGSADTLGMVKGLAYMDGAKYFYDVKEGTYESNLAYVYGIGFGSSTAFGNRSHSIDHPELSYFTEVLQYCLGVPLEEIEPYTYSRTHGDGYNRLTMLDTVIPCCVSGFPSTVYYTADEQATIDEISLLLNAHVTTEVAKFITGVRDISEFDQFVSECEAYGLRELEEIYRKAYANYLASK